MKLARDTDKIKRTTKNSAEVWDFIQNPFNATAYSLPSIESSHPANISYFSLLITHLKPIMISIAVGAMRSLGMMNL
mgnify:FL=1